MQSRNVTHCVTLKKTAGKAHDKYKQDITVNRMIACAGHVMASFLRDEIKRRVVFASWKFFFGLHCYHFAITQEISYSQSRYRINKNSSDVFPFKVLMQTNSAVASSKNIICWVRPSGEDSRVLQCSHYLHGGVITIFPISLIHWVAWNISSSSKTLQLGKLP